MKAKTIILSTLMLTTLAACQSELPIEPQTAEADAPATYRLRLSAGVTPFDDEPQTRATGYQWAVGNKIFLRFKVSGQQDITGNAVCQAVNGESTEWTFTPSASSRRLPNTDQGECQCFYVDKESSSTATIIALATDTKAYQDLAATYTVSNEENFISVVSLMTPITGRLRFHGTQGTQPKVDGLQFYTTFTIASTSFGTAEKKSIEPVIASNGYSPYYYAEFDNAQRQLHITFDAYTGALRSFPQGVLAKGQGGYITMPTLASHAGWTLVNADRQQITVPTVSATPTVQKFSHKSASLSATITNSGNGRISDTGFLIGTSTNRAEATITAKGGTSETITATATGLTEKTTYYVWAYATNQAGTGYSNSYATFTTKETPPDTNFDIDDFGDDNNWD